MNYDTIKNVLKDSSIMNKEELLKCFRKNEGNFLKAVRELAPYTEKLMKIFNQIPDLKRLLDEYQEVSLNKQLELADKFKKINNKYELIKSLVGNNIENLKANKNEQNRVEEIAWELDLFKRNQGKYPLIHLSFKDATFPDFLEKDRQDHNVIWEEFIAKIKIMISTLYKEHAYLLNAFAQKINNPNSSASEKSIAETNFEMFNSLLKKKNASSQDIIDSIRFLSEILFNHFDQKVIVLIDEYDAPFNSLIGSEEAFNKILNFFKGFLLRSLKDNEYVEKTILTGILRIAKASLFSGLNNFCEYSIFDKRFAPYYGFTEREVECLLDVSFEVGINQEKRKQIKQ